VLIPRLTVFDNRLLRNDLPAEVGFTATHLCIRVENWWTFYLGLDRTSRYPNVAELLASLSPTTTRWVIDPGEADLLRHELPRLPKGEDNLARVEVELGEVVVLRAGVPGSEQATELALGGSRVVGEHLRFSTNPLYLWRALGLGFVEVRLRGPDRPLLCEDERRKYVWMPLVSAGVAERKSGG
jgi:hypothetical protein